MKLIETHLFFCHSAPSFFPSSPAWERGRGEGVPSRVKGFISFVLVGCPMLVTFLACAAFLIGGCVTQQQVRTIVAESNAAMITPFLDKAGEKGTPGWQEAVAKIDQLIAANPDQTILVNHLRVRQAMLLTVNKQKYLAAQVWNQVAANALRTERDQSLFNHKDALMWWFGRASDPNPLAGDEQKDAKKHLLELDETITGLKTRDIRLYVGTLRAQIALKLRNDTSVTDATQRAQLAQDMADDLSKYVSIFSPEDAEWVRNRANENIKSPEEGMVIADLRYRVWLRDMVLEFKDTARRSLCGSHLTEPCVPGPYPDWKPSWIKEY